MKRAKKKRSSACPPPPRGRSLGQGYPLSLRRKAVRLHLEEGIPVSLLSQELRVGRCTLLAWAKRYREEGEEGLKPRPRGFTGRRGRSAVAPAVKEKIVDLRRNNPGFGVRRIAQSLKRVFMLPASPETVRRTLKAAELIPPRRTKPRRNPPKPRFFERATPNQMWQSDIFTFRLQGQNAYLIGFIDDYSRYLVGLNLYRSQTSENVLEVYRTAVGEYGLPKEMLTDNGRQYTNWRGRTRFERELQKDRVHHLRSRPHHPMTLGKIERFWKTIWEEFLSRASFNGLEEARERIRLWVKYYNHKRPHQGIGGMFPADRFFSIQKGLREVMEKGIAANVQELALRGEPKSPFYLVGRLGKQSVVIQEEQGKVRMVIDGEDQKEDLVHNLGGSQGDERSGKQGQGGREGEEGTGDTQRQGEVRGGAGGLDGTAAPGASVPEALDLGGDLVELAGSGAAGDAGGAGTADEDRRQRGAVASLEAGEEAGSAGGAAGSEADEAGPAAGEDRRGQGDNRDGLSGCGYEREEERDAGEGVVAGGDDHRGPGGEAERPGSGPEAGGLDQDVLQVGKAGVGRSGGGVEDEKWRPPRPEEGPREGSAAGGAGPVPRAGADLATEVSDPGTAG